MLNLGFNLEFADLYGRDGLHKVDAAFLSELDAADPALHLRLSKARLDVAALDAKQQSQLLIDLAPHVDDFVGTLFGIRAQLGALAEQHHTARPVVRSQAAVRAAPSRQGLRRRQRTVAGRGTGWVRNWRRGSGPRPPKVPRSNWRSRAACCAG